MSVEEETQEEFAARMAGIREAGPDAVKPKVHHEGGSGVAKMPAHSPDKSLKQRSHEPRKAPPSSRMAPEPISSLDEIPPRAQKEIDRIDQRTEMGMGCLPWGPNDEGFVSVASDPTVSLTEITEIAANWFVKKDLKYFDVWNQGQSLTQADVEQIVKARLKDRFPKLKLSEGGRKDLLTQLCDGDSDPGRYFKVWSGRARSVPGNRQRLLYSDGMVDINTWVAPKYRQQRAVPDLGAFGKLLEFAIVEEAERQMLLDWLAWCLQNEKAKPSWAIFLYSDEKGTGKSTIADVARALFGKENTAAINGIDKLVGRFNKTVLDKKLVVAEEVQIPANSPKGNALKDLITGRFTTVEEKGRETEEVEHRTCLILTTNHKPIWLEAGERRYYILHLSHEGHAQGPEREAFTKIVSQVQDDLRSPVKLAGIYQALLHRTPSAAFNPHSLDFETQATKVMREIEGLSPDQTQETLRDLLAAYSVVAIPGIEVPKLLRYLNIKSVNTPKYLFDRLGWEKRRLAWGGGKTADLWVRKDVEIERGKILLPRQPEEADQANEPKVNEVPLGQHLDDTWGPLVQEVLDLKRGPSDPGSKLAQFDGASGQGGNDSLSDDDGAVPEIPF